MKNALQLLSDRIDELNEQLDDDYLERAYEHDRRQDLYRELRFNIDLLPDTDIKKNIERLIDDYLLGKRGL